MKKFLGLLVICICFALKVLAFEDYIVLSTKPVKKVESSNPQIVVANILVTIMNEKNTIIVHPKGKGKAVLTFTMQDEVLEVPIEIKENKTIFKKNEKFEFIQMDIPPEMFDIDLPPAAMSPAALPPAVVSPACVPKAASPKLLPQNRFGKGHWR